MRSVVPSTENLEVGARLAMQAAAMEADNNDPLGLGRIDTRQLALVGGSAGAMRMHAEPLMHGRGKDRGKHGCCMQLKCCNAAVPAGEGGAEQGQVDGAARQHAAACARHPLSSYPARPFGHIWPLHACQLSLHVLASEGRPASSE